MTRRLQLLSHIVNIAAAFLHKLVDLPSQGELFKSPGGGDDHHAHATEEHDHVLANGEHGRIALDAAVEDKKADEIIDERVQKGGLAEGRERLLGHLD